MEVDMVCVRTELLVLLVIKASYDSCQIDQGIESGPSAQTPTDASIFLLNDGITEEDQVNICYHDFRCRVW